MVRRCRKGVLHRTAQRPGATAPRKSVLVTPHQVVGADRPVRMRCDGRLAVISPGSRLQSPSRRHRRGARPAGLEYGDYMKKSKEKGRAPASGRSASVVARGSAAIKKHIEALSKFSPHQIADLMGTAKGVRRLAGCFRGGRYKDLPAPKFSEIVEAVPGRLNDEELAKVLSGGTPTEWGPWRHAAAKLMARRRAK